MAAPNVFGNGIGGSSGDSLATGKPLYLANGGFVWYVGPGGSDAAATGGALDGGRRREAPLATTAQAITNASDGDVVCYLAGHAETLPTAVTIGKKVTLVSEGTGSQAARFTCSGAVNMFDVTVASVRFRNLYFPASSAVPTSRIRIATAGCQITDCYFECGVNDTTHAVAFVTGASHGRLTGTSFVATAATPAIGLEVVNAMTGLDLVDCTFDGGSFGWSAYAFTCTGAVTNLTGLRVNLLNQSDAHVVTGSSGWLLPGVVSGGSVVRIDS